MIKQNQKSLVFFIIKETVHCLTKKATNGQFIEENEIAQHILNEMLKNNLSETLTIMDTGADPTMQGSMPKNAFDYNILYCLVDVLISIGFLSKRIDSTTNSRSVSWEGFKRFREKS